jgi:hypothetical protein
MGDYVAAGVKNQGNQINYGRKSGEIISQVPENGVSIEPGTEVDMKIVGTSDGFTLTFDGMTASAGYDYPLTGVDSDYIYVGFFAVRNCNITFSDIHLDTGAAVEEPEVTVEVNDESMGKAEVVENEDGSVTVVAKAEEGYEFVGWVDEEGNVVSTDPEYTFTSASGKALKAMFAKKEAGYTGFQLEDGTPFFTLSPDQDLYWYEDGVRQGVAGDQKNIWDTAHGQYERGREIYDPNSNAWYWLDAIYDGRIARNKEVWMPYVFQGDGDPDGKWVRYDKYGQMIKGWYACDAGVYYYDKTTGKMFYGEHEIGGKSYYFDPVTGIMQ